MIQGSKGLKHVPLQFSVVSPKSIPKNWHMCNYGLWKQAFVLDFQAGNYKIQCVHLEINGARVNRQDAYV